MTTPHNEDWIEEQVKDFNENLCNEKSCSCQNEWLRETLAAAIQRGTENLEVNSPEWKQWCADLRAEGAKQERERILAALPLNVHLITGSNGMCECGNDGHCLTKIKSALSPRSEGENDV